MSNPRQFKILALGALFLLSTFCISSSLLADARTDYLIKMLETGGSYLVKVQAASSLGKLRAKEAIPALKNALSTEDELVVIAAATALGQIGDPSVIPALEAARGKAKSGAARLQIDTTLQVLRVLSPVAGESVPSVELSQAAGNALYLVKIDAMGNTTSLSGSDVDAMMRKVVAQSLTESGLVQIQTDGLKESQVKKKLAAEKLKGFIVSGSLLKFERKSNYVEVSISLNIFSNPDYNLLMMPSGGIRVPISSGDKSPSELRLEEEKAVKRLVDDLLGKAMAALPDVL